jgi:hypothetical protein
VINWWLSLDKEAMKNHKEWCIDIFKHPLVSLDLKALRTSAKGAARTEANGVTPSLLQSLILAAWRSIA